jgi:hypothetical protein
MIVPMCAERGRKEMRNLDFRLNKKELSLLDPFRLSFAVVRWINRELPKPKSNPY